MAPPTALPERAPPREHRVDSPERIATGLHKIGLILRNAAWRDRGRSGLTPTQAQLLAALTASAGHRTVSSLAAELGVTPPTASDSLTALERKGLVARRRAAGDGRVVAVRPTPGGRRAARTLALWPDSLLDALQALDASERAVLQRALVKMIRSFQAQGRMPIARMCVGCRFFRPYAHAGSSKPHHCAFVDAAFGDAELRLDCADHGSLPSEEADALWKRFLAGTARSSSRKEF